MTTTAVPESGLDPYTDDALLDPWHGYRTLRDAGPAVWLTKYGMYAVARHSSVRRAPSEWEVFSSAHGVLMNDEMNQVLRGNTLAATARRTTRCARW